MNRNRRVIGFTFALAQIANAITPDGAPPIKNLQKAYGMFKIRVIMKFRRWRDDNQIWN